MNGEPPGYPRDGSDRERALNGRVTVREAAVLVVDLQIEHVRALATARPDQLAARVDALCAGADLHGVPVVVTGAELGDTRAPFPDGLAARGPVWRSTADAFDSSLVERAIDALARTTLIVCGVATDIGVALAALSARDRDYRVFVPLDACGANDARAEDAAVARLRAADVTMTSVGAILAEWQRDFALPNGAATLQLIRAGGSPPRAG